MSRTPRNLTGALAAVLVLLLMQVAFAQDTFVGPGSGGPASGTINGNTLTYNGATYQRVGGKVKFPDGTIYIAMDDGALIPAVATPGARPGGIRPDRPSTTGPRPNESGTTLSTYSVEPYAPVANAGTGAAPANSNVTTANGPVVPVSTPEVGNATGGPGPQTQYSTVGHPAVGSWFGKAIQVCPSGVAPSACAGGQPANALFMTPTLTSEGIFLGNDSFALLPPPFGPHTTAHGQWYATGANTFTAEYVFMTGTYPPIDRTVTGFRFRWLAQVISNDTAVGYVNLYILQNVPLTWTPLQANEFPAFPAEANGFITSPVGVVTDPSTCRTDGCPLVFKFTIKRVRQ